MLVFSFVRLQCIFKLVRALQWQNLVEVVGESLAMWCVIFCVNHPHSHWSLVNGIGGDVCFYVVKYVCVGSLDLNGGLRCMDVFVWVAFFDVQG